MAGRVKKLIKILIFLFKRSFFQLEYTYSSYKEYIFHILKGGNFEKRLKHGDCLTSINDLISNDRDNRLAIFVAFHESNQIPLSNIEYIKSLINCSFNVLYVHNGNLNQNAKDTLKNIGCIVICRENIGQDFGAWKDIILYLNKFDLLNKLNWLLICNDSNFYTGGINGEAFENRFNERLNHASDHDFISLLCSYQMILHHQSYFLCFSNSILRSNKFIKFWENYRILSNRYHAIKKGEKEINSTILKFYRQSILYTAMDLYQSIINSKEDKKITKLIKNLPINAFYLEASIIQSESEKIAILRALSMLEKYNQSHAFALLLVLNSNYPFIKKDIVLKGSFSMSQISEIIFREAIISNKQLAKEIHAHFLKVGLPYSYWQSPGEAHRKGIEPFGELYDAYPDSQVYINKYMSADSGKI